MFLVFFVISSSVEVLERRSAAKNLKIGLFTIQFTDMLWHGVGEILVKHELVQPYAGHWVCWGVACAPTANTVFQMPCAMHIWRCCCASCVRQGSHRFLAGNDASQCRRVFCSRVSHWTPNEVSVVAHGKRFRWTRKACSHDYYRASPSGLL